MPKGICPCSQWDMSKKQLHVQRWWHLRSSGEHLPHILSCARAQGHRILAVPFFKHKRTQFWRFVWKLVVSDGGVTIIFKRRDKLFWSFKDSGRKMPLMVENRMSKQKLACISRCPPQCNEMHRESWYSYRQQNLHHISAFYPHHPIQHL